MPYLWKNGPVFAPAPGFPVGTDSVLLADFAARPGSVRACDLGCGAGLMTVLLCAANARAAVTGVELDPDTAELARRNLADNGLESRASVLTADLREHRSLLPSGSFDLVLCNPPYFPQGSGRLSPDRARAAARSELCCTLEDVCAAAAWLLRGGGAFCLVHRPERLSQVLCAMSAAGVEPKRLRLVSRLPESAPSLVLAEGRRRGAPGLRLEPPLILCQPDGSPSPQFKRIYHLE